MHVGIITYQTGHLKTYQLFLKFLLKNFKITLFAFPFKLRSPKKETRFMDRPYQIIDLDIKDFCKRYNIGYVEVEGWDDSCAEQLGVAGSKNNPDFFVTCIAKIIPKSFIEGRTILNCHPGLLPENRGLGANKWCVFKEMPFGITLHIIDEEIDRGQILARIRVPILKNDTFADVCHRAYIIDVDLMANFDRHLNKRSKKWFVGDDFPVSHKLISKEMDEKIEDTFLKKRDLFIKLSSDSTNFSHPSDIFY